MHHDVWAGAAIGIAGATLLNIGVDLAFPDKPKSDIGISFKDSREASIRREFGLLSKDQLDKAVSKAVEQYMATGSTTPVVVELPPRPVAKTPALAAP